MKISVFNIEAFTATGAVADTGDFYKYKVYKVESDLMKDMAERGFVQVLDITPIINIEYSAEKECFLYELTMFGIEVGDDAWEYIGWMNGRLITRTPPSKSGPLSATSE